MNKRIELEGMLRFDKVDGHWEPQPVIGDLRLTKEMLDLFDLVVPRSQSEGYDVKHYGVTDTVVRVTVEIVSKTVYVVMDSCGVQGVYSKRESADAVVSSGLGTLVIDYRMDYGVSKLAQGLLPWRVRLALKEGWRDGPIRIDLNNDYFVDGLVQNTEWYVHVDVWAYDSGGAVIEARKVYERWKEKQGYR